VFGFWVGLVAAAAPPNAPATLRAMAEDRRILAVVFDAVGTLILPREPVGGSYARLAREHGVDVPASRLEEAFRRVLAVAPPNVQTGPEAAERERSWWRERVRETFRAADGMARFDDFEAFFAEVFAHYAEASAWRLVEGARPCLDALVARGYRLGVLSNFDQRLHGVLAGLGLAERFEVVTLPADAGAAKPARAIFDACRARVGLAPSQLLHVGDDAARDVAAARAAGWRALDVTTLPGLDALPAAIDRLETEGAAA
jgi:putative hydrolase of the HAD superfamily